MLSAGGTEELIVEAARKVFLLKGFAATRMCDIAAAANINPALLHYYFRNKAKLFQIVYDQESEQFLHELTAILHSERPFFEKLRLIIRRNVEKFQSQIFVLNETSRHSDHTQQLMEKSTSYRLIFNDFSKLVQLEERAGRIRPVCPRQLLISILGITMMPYLAQSMMEIFMDLDTRAFDQLMLERADHISDLLINGLQERT